MQMAQHALQTVALLAGLLHCVELQSQIIDSLGGRQQCGIDMSRGRVIEEKRHLTQRMRD